MIDANVEAELGYVAKLGQECCFFNEGLKTYIFQLIKEAEHPKRKFGNLREVLASSANFKSIPIVYLEVALGLSVFNVMAFSLLQSIVPGLYLWISSMTSSSPPLM